MTRTLLILMVAAIACRGDKPPTPAAGSSAAAPVDHDAAFWKWFTDHAATLRSDGDLRKTMETISDEIEKSHPGVFAEIGADGDNRTLVLSADGKRDLFPIVAKLYASRPTVAGWTIVAFRQRDEHPTTIELGDKKIDPATVKFVATEAAGKLDLEVFLPGFTTTDDMGQIAFVILDHVVGEYDMETKIAGIDFAPLDKAPPGAKMLPELAAVVDKLK